MIYIFIYIYYKMTSLQNGNYNSRSMNGLTSIYANDIVADTIDVIDATVENNLSVGNNLDITNNVNIGNGLDVGGSTTLS